MNKTEMSKPNKLFDDHTRSFNLVRGGLEKYYSNYVNKKKIIVLLEFWLFSVITIYEIYGHKALVRYGEKNIKSPLRFSYLEQYCATEELTLSKSKTDLPTSLFRLMSKIILPGAPIEKIRDKLNSRITNRFVSINTQEVSIGEAEVIFDLISEYFEINRVHLKKDFIELILPKVFLSKQIKISSKNDLIAEGTAHAFMDFIGYEKILLLDRKIVMDCCQHGGGYDMFVNDHYSNFEKNLSDKFVGWGLSKVNQRQLRFRNQGRNDQTKKRKIIWVERARYPNFLKPMNFGQYLQFTDTSILNYISCELKRGAPDFFSMPHPSTNRSDDYDELRGKNFDNSKIGGENLIGNKDIVIFDNTASTLMHFCMQNNITFFLAVSEKSIDYLSENAYEWFELLRKYRFAFFERETGYLSERLQEAQADEASVSKELIKINKDYYL